MYDMSMRKLSLIISPMLIAAAVVGYTLFFPSISKSCSPIDKGVSYLDTRFHPVLGLLNESPQVAPHKYWLANDNLLAAHALAELGRTGLSNKIILSARTYGVDRNGLIEVIWGVPVTYPPFVGEQILIKRIEDNEIWQENHLQGSQFLDWQEYANLGFLGALNQFHRGNIQEAIDQYDATLVRFDGIGFKDKAHDGRYETYKLALAIFTGRTLQTTNPDEGNMLSILTELQAEDGGFYTHYVTSDSPQGDTNTETTSLALLALHIAGCPAP